MVSIKMVAQEAGVSTMTASRVLNNYPHVSEKVKVRVLDAAKRLSYQPNQAARIMRGKKAYAIGVMIPDFGNPFYTNLIQCLESCLAPLGYRLMTTSNSAYTNQIVNIQNFLSRNLDGLIICSYRGMKGARKFIMENYPNMPTVIFDDVKEGGSVYTVYADGFTGIKRMVSYLYEIGHREIGIIKGESALSIANDRYEGYLDSMKEYGLDFHEEWVYNADYSMESGMKAAQYFVGLEHRPTAVLATSDYMAIGAINYLINHNYKVPEDLTVTGYDGMYLGNLITPRLTTIQLPVKEMAQTATQIIINSLDNSKQERKKNVFIGELLVRDST